RAIDREISTALHMTHMGCSSLPEALIRQSLRSGLSDGWGGSMMGTEFSDVMFGTPKPVDTTANIGVIEKDNVNNVVQGHDPSLPEALSRQALRSGLSDGWGGSMMGTEFCDVMFGTPKPVDTTANIGVMEKDNVNIVVHGHDPTLSEMIVYYANDPEMNAYAK